MRKSSKLDRLAGTSLDVSRVYIVDALDKGASKSHALVGTSQGASKSQRCNSRQFAGDI